MYLTTWAAALLKPLTIRKSSYVSRMASEASSGRFEARQWKGIENPNH